MTSNKSDQTFADVEAEAFAEHEANKIAEKERKDAEDEVKWAASRKIRHHLRQLQGRLKMMPKMKTEQENTR